MKEPWAKRKFSLGDFGEMREYEYFYDTERVIYYLRLHRSRSEELGRNADVLHPLYG